MNPGQVNGTKESHQSTDGNCCSTIERVWLMKGGKRMEHAGEQGWRISEVERLTGLSRRDIQRCCYEGKGGVGILSPKGSSWGRRIYNKRDLATLFVVASYRSRGLTLPQVKEIFDQHRGADGLEELLEEELERTNDQLDRLLARHIGTRALLASLGEDSSRSLAELFKAVAAAYLAKHDLGKDPLDDLLALPGMELLVELWFGPHQ